MRSSESNPESSHADSPNVEPATPRIFISYSHDSESHRAYCLNLTQDLRRAGINAWIDQFESSPERGWPRWMQEQLEGAAYTLLICTEHYKRRFEGDELAGQGQGANWEGFLTQQMLYDDDARNRRFIPILRDGEATELVPRVLRGATVYRLPSNFDSLVRRLTQPPVAPVAVTYVRAKRPSERVQDEELNELYELRKRLTIGERDTSEVEQRILVRRRQLRDFVEMGEGSRLFDNRFEIVEQIGQGGFGVVWKAYDNQRTELVAVKTLHHQFRGDSTRRERFFRGARAMSSLDHPGVVKVLQQSGRPDEPAYFVMEYVPNGDLESMVLKGNWQRSLMSALLQRLGEALQHAHSRRLVHRDIKPANILMTADGLPKLSDFDLVHAADTTGGTRTGALGTFLYAAPEALEDASQVGPAADIYSLGMVGVFALLGKRLPSDILRNPTAIIAALPCHEALKSLLGRACAWRPSERPADAASFLKELAEANAATQIGSLTFEQFTTPKSEEPVAAEQTEPRLLRFISGKYQGGEFPLNENGEVVAGRSTTADMVLVEEMVSRRHARFLIKNGRVTIEDLGSTNGTFVNGQRVTSVELEVGDRILIGSNILKVVGAAFAQ